MIYSPTESVLSSSKDRTNSSVLMSTSTPGMNNSERLATLWDFHIKSFNYIPKYYCQVNVLFVVDEVSDGQNGKDARETGRVFVNAMKYPDWDDGSILAKITKEYASSLYQIVATDLTNQLIDSALGSSALLEQGTWSALEISARVIRNALPGKPNLENGARSLTLHRSYRTAEITAPLSSASHSPNTSWALT